MNRNCPDLYCSFSFLSFQGQFQGVAVQLARLFDDIGVFLLQPVLEQFFVDIDQSGGKYDREHVEAGHRSRLEQAVDAGEMQQGHQEEQPDEPMREFPDVIRQPDIAPDKRNPGRQRQQHPHADPNEGYFSQRDAQVEPAADRHDEKMGQDEGVSEDG